jgi:hypothetical protein
MWRNSARRDFFPNGCCSAATHRSVILTNKEIVNFSARDAVGGRHRGVQAGDPVRRF